MEQERNEPLVRIGELARRVNVTPTLLRAWEKRYGLLAPTRSSGNFRLYSPADERRIATMKRQMDRGVSAAEAARLAIEAEESAPAASPANEVKPVDEHRAFAEAALRFDETAVQAILDRAFAHQHLEQVVNEFVLPSLRDIGEGWERSEVTVAQEHFVSNILRARLLALARGWESGTGRPIVLACAPDELHDIPLICFGLTMWRRGWRIIYLGQATPVADMGSGAESVDAAALVVIASVQGRLEQAADGLHELAGRRRVAIAGAGANPAIAERLGAELLAGDPVSAAIDADRRWGGYAPV